MAQTGRRSSRADRQAEAAGRIPVAFVRRDPFPEHGLTRLVRLEDVVPRETHRTCVGMGRRGRMLTLGLQARVTADVEAIESVSEVTSRDLNDAVARLQEIRIIIGSVQAEISQVGLVALRWGTPRPPF